MTLYLPHRHTGNCPMQAVTHAALLWTCGCRQSMQHGPCSFPHPFQNYAFRLLSSEAFSPRSPQTQQAGWGGKAVSPQARRGTTFWVEHLGVFQRHGANMATTHTGWAAGAVSQHTHSARWLPGSPAAGLFSPLPISNRLCEVVPHLKPLVPQWKKAMPNLSETAPAIPHKQMLPPSAAGTSTPHQGQQHPLLPVLLTSFFRMTWTCTY